MTAARASAADGESHFSPQFKQQLRRRLLAWYRRARRDLPWRKTRDPYAIWLSEIMLQQTQVVTVIPYFERFLRSWPNIAALAKANERDVLRAWEGLGYYRRARQLHAAAKAIVQTHDGVFPSDMAAVRSLPGIGRYTAGAILSIAFGQRVPILEANTQRLLARLLALDAELSTSAAQETLWQAAAELLPRQEVGQFNQALMELGALVCQPRQPDCAHCPALGLCPTQQQGRTGEIPRQKTRAKTEHVREVVVAVRHRGRLLMRRYEQQRRWHGLWDFLRFAAPAGPKLISTEGIARTLRSQFGVDVKHLVEVQTLRHSVTRFRIALVCYQADWRAGTVPRDGELRWVAKREVPQLPLHITARKLAAQLLQS